MGLQRSDHRSVQVLEADIRNWIKDWNTHPKPFIWTKTAEQILTSLARLLKRITGAGHGSNSAWPARRAVTRGRAFTAPPIVGHIDLAASITGRVREEPLPLLWEMLMDIDGSFELDVERTGWDDIALVLPRHDLRINLDPVEAARICRDIWAALDREQPAANSYVA